MFFQTSRHIQLYIHLHRCRYHEGLLVHSWESNLNPKLSVYLLENGNLIRTGIPSADDNKVFNAGGMGGHVQMQDWNGNVLWNFRYSTDQYCLHHDIEPLPNGNVLMIAWELKSRDEVIAAGRNPAFLNGGQLWPDHIIEVKPTGSEQGEIVWEWYVWDHLIQDYDSTKINYGVIAEYPELIDINFSSSGPGSNEADWNHTNSVDYNPQFDQILLSVHGFDEIWIIDHSTTTEEAASHSGGKYSKGGDLLYRWGNPIAYRGGILDDQKLFNQHDAQWIEQGNPGAGNILIFNNGLARPEGNYSTVEEIVRPVDNAGFYAKDNILPFGPSEQLWIYQALNPEHFYSGGISGAQRLPNGNTLICNGAFGAFFEVTHQKEMVWLYINPVTRNGTLTQGQTIPGNANGTQNKVFKIRRYAPDYPGFNNHDLTPGNPIELYPDYVAQQAPEIPPTFELYQNYPNPFNPLTNISFSIKQSTEIKLIIYDMLGREVKTLVDRIISPGNYSLTWDGTDNKNNCVRSGIYMCRILSEQYSDSQKMVLIR